MKIPACCLFLALLACTSAPAAAKEPVRINGASETSFDASFAKLVRSLKAQERRRLALGLFGALLPHECLQPDSIVYLTFSTVEPKDGPRVRSCREHLNGMSYQEILEAAEPKESPSTSPRPNNAFKPNVLRYTNNMADRACHVVAFATHVGLT